ncbi:AmpG family muropeptide MFS transporter [Kordiimonas laminariae]|uniref:AmpG family muropeptide MFS transporter n=1 Tax=Kordiimonas laminariae TaxID=2917717 RepID=UPI001FF1FBF4|nr:MFS transporter [Kordiimonas laminariae]MCK0070259.1 MFS transporter [Kordiimonas laminariae]
MGKVGGILRGLKPYGDKRVVGTFGLGMASGFPLTFVISLMGFWLSYNDVSKADVGLFALATSFYTWKFLWSPAIDRLPLGPITKIFGQRRGWLLFIQGLMAACLLAISVLNPADQLFEVAVFTCAIAFLSASQDIVIDAYRIEILGDEDQGHSAASYVFGYRTANFIAGVGVLLIADQIGWGLAISLLPLLLLPGTLAVLWLGEPTHSRADDEFMEAEAQRAPKSLFAARFREAVILPFKEFSKRDNWLLVLLFILFFKAGDAVASIMTAPLIRDMEFSLTAVAYANKTVGFITLMVGVGLGAALYKQIGMYKALFLSGILMMLTNLGFAWLSVGETEQWRLAVVIGMENFATGLGTTVIIAYMASLCNANFTATQYALLSSLANQARTVLGAPSGFVAESVGWVEFFVYATLLAIPGLILLYILMKKDIAGLKNTHDLEKVNI